MGIYFIIAVGIFSGYLFLTAPSRECTSLPCSLMVPYAHRGLHFGEVPENSMAAFRRAVEDRCGIELDVRLTKDGEVVVFHDDELFRMCKSFAAVSSLTYDELSKLRISGTNERIPRLSEVLSEVSGQVPLLIELKGSDTALCDRVFDLLDSYGGAFSIEAFDPRMLYYVRKKRPSYYRGQLVTRVRKGEARISLIARLLLSHMLLNFLSRPHYTACDKRWYPRVAIFFASHLFGVKKLMWVARGDDECKRMMDDGIIPIFEKIDSDDRI